VGDPDLLDAHRAGVLVDLDFDHLRGVTEARRGADGGAAELAALRFRRRRPGALDGERARFGQRGLHASGEVEHAVGAQHPARFAAPLHFFRRDFQFLAAAFTSARLSASAARSAALPTMNETATSRSRCPWRERAVGRDHADACHRQQQHLGHHLRQ